METFEIGLTLAFAVALIINIKNVDWKSAKTYKVALLTLLVIGFGVGILFLNYQLFWTSTRLM